VSLSDRSNGGLNRGLARGPDIDRYPKRRPLNLQYHDDVIPPLRKGGHILASASAFNQGKEQKSQTLTSRQGVVTRLLRLPRNIQEVCEPQAPPTREKSEVKAGKPGLYGP